MAIFYATEEWIEDGQNQGILRKFSSIKERDSFVENENSKSNNKCLIKKISASAVKKHHFFKNLV